jgi:hypothetical protein
MRLKVIGMQFNQAGHHQITLNVFAAAREHRPHAKFDDLSAGCSDPSPLQDMIAQHQPSVRQDHFGSF